MSPKRIDEKNQKERLWRAKRIKKNKRFAQNLKTFIAENFASQSDFAWQFDINLPTLSHYCSGNAKIPSPLLIKMNKTFPGKINFNDFADEPFMGWISLITD